MHYRDMDRIGSKLANLESIQVSCCGQRQNFIMSFPTSIPFNTCERKYCLRLIAPDNNKLGDFRLQEVDSLCRLLCPEAFDRGLRANGRPGGGKDKVWFDEPEEKDDPFLFIDLPSDQVQINTEVRVCVHTLCVYECVCVCAVIQP
jgi:hypothetical protein